MMELTTNQNKIMKIIGTALTIDLTFKDPQGKQEVIKGGKYNIVGIGEFENGVKVYITDKEHSPGQPLLLVEQLISEYKPISD